MNTTKRNILHLLLSAFLLPSYALAENGLEGIIVEKYYVSDKNDERASKGQINKGTVTYRIYADLLPGYLFQAAYGVPGHVMFLETSSYFYNTAEFQAAIANDISLNDLNKGFNLIDSWLSVGAACESCYGIMKEDDTTKAGINADGVLLNDAREAGVSLTTRDGLFPASPMKQVVFYGLDSLQLQSLRLTNPKAKGQRLQTDNGSWACLSGSSGSNEKNQVLIAQLTTDGELSFKLNLQIGTPFGGVQNYVAENPVGNEISLESLTYPRVVKESEGANQRVENNAEQVKIVSPN